MERGTFLAGLRVSSARLDTVSIPVYAIMEMAMPITSLSQVGATPQCTLSIRVSMLSRRNSPRTTRNTWVSKSITARPMLTPDDCFTPMTLTVARNPTTPIPNMAFAGQVFRMGRKTAR